MLDNSCEEVLIEKAMAIFVLLVVIISKEIISKSLEFLRIHILTPPLLQLLTMSNLLCSWLAYCTNQLKMSTPWMLRISITDKYQKCQGGLISRLNYALFSRKNVTFWAEVLMYVFSSLWPLFQELENTTIYTVTSWPSRPNIVLSLRHIFIPNFSRFLFEECHNIMPYKE